MESKCRTVLLYNVDMKKCLICKETKALSEFWKNGTRNRHKCDECVNNGVKTKDLSSGSKCEHGISSSDKRCSECLRIYQRKYKNQRKATDPIYKLQHNLRSRLRKALKGKPKAGSAVRDLGCSLSEFKKYMESRFQPGMTWENHGFNGWHIDHIIPMSSFDLTNIEEVRKACHYTNLQPLWWHENLAKGDN